MLIGFARYLIIDTILSILKTIPALVMLIPVIWLITGTLLSCSSNTKHIIAQDYYICSNAKGD